MVVWQIYSARYFVQLVQSTHDVEGEQLHWLTAQFQSAHDDGKWLHGTSGLIQQVYINTCTLIALRSCVSVSIEQAQLIRWWFSMGSFCSMGGFCASFLTQDVLRLCFCPSKVRAQRARAETLCLLSDLRHNKVIYYYFVYD